MSLVRVETPADRDAVHAVNASAFVTSAEADLVDVLREQARPLISLVAEVGREIVGHILFTPVSLSERPDLQLMGLAPMAVAPEHQKTGIGSALVREGLQECGRRGFVGVVVLGHAEYYPRFGFTPASRFGIGCEWEVPDEVFMAMELIPGALSGVTGTVKYHPAFGAAE